MKKKYKCIASIVAICASGLIAFHLNEKRKREIQDFIKNIEKGLEEDFSKISTLF